ncbi:NTPase, partial [Schumannella luteola]
MTESNSETGPQFEKRVLALARAIHDPLGTQGAEIYEGRERDSVFTNESQVHVYEVTTLRTKEKAEYDGQKLVDMMKSLAAKPENLYRSVNGWFVTREEPTPEQRTVIQALAKKNALPLKAISASTLLQRICNSELYLQQRDSAPFGSLAYAPAASGAGFRVDVDFETIGNGPRSVGNVSDALLGGRHIVLTGDFGVGKSHGLREIYRSLRRDHFRGNKLTRFPVHINLRDCVGLRTPAEIFRRHAEDIGFVEERSLISAWRSGGVVLLLDGFDEIVPVRWMGNAADLREVRWEAMAPIRRLVEETPEGTGIIICGRPNYFSTNDEMKVALGFDSRADSIFLADFDHGQIAEYLQKASVDWQVPDWIPGRPLLLGYLASMHEVSGDSEEMDRSVAWRQLLQAICQR